MAGPLDGIRILDLCTIYSGPICASILGDQGADVVKVESPAGDFMRTPAGVSRNGVGAAFAMMNRNKRSIVLDLKTADGKAVFEKLVETADVVIENYRPGVMERLGIGYDTLKAINPKIVFASINGVGHTGPYSGRRVYDAIVQSISGIGSLQTDPKIGRPELINSLICDKLTSMTAAQSISSALVARERTGVGQRVDISMLESALFFLWSDNMLPYSLVGEDPDYAWTPSHAGMIRATKDGFVCVMPVQAEEWRGIFAALELPVLHEDPAYHTPDGIDMDKFNATVNNAFARFDTTTLEARLEEHQVPWARVNARDEVVNDPQIQAMESLWEYDHPFAGPIRQARPPARYSETPSEIFRPSPELGEHTTEVLAEAGYSVEEIKALRATQSIR